MYRTPPVQWSIPRDPIDRSNQLLLPFLRQCRWSSFITMKLHTVLQLPNPFSKSIRPQTILP